ncbi:MULTISPECIES: hypothetical protein [unclassified Sporosarcina]|uniref:hypothetical protein n=1 Tax=unclassified Sporosarcina TaxID=2647733 RepID=UPI000C16651A|nr:MULTISPECIES: hypothetical protein [unclassified Sporosarcina]PID05823.1 hypothetical protein CSV66_07475 [Sporosarcina sp. P30]PID09017.1 hypothetical protein CSV65_07475 [Sporosarcina sp. P31]PID12314.1 hypothetical protein CSV64_06945 [Sporosarcina sp. P32b]
MSKKKFNTIYIMIVTVPFLLLIFPLFELANRATPIIMGLPFSFFYIILLILLTFLGVLILYRFDPDHKLEEGDE